MVQASGSLTANAQSAISPFVDGVPASNVLATPQEELRLQLLPLSCIMFAQLRSQLLAYCESSTDRFAGEKASSHWSSGYPSCRKQAARCGTHVGERGSETFSAVLAEEFKLDKFV